MTLNPTDYCGIFGIKDMLNQIITLPQTLRRVFMNRFVSGIVMGSAMAMAGYCLLNMNETDKKKMARTGRKMINKAEDVIDDITDSIW